MEDENKNVLFYLVEIFPHTLRPARNRLRKAWKRVFPDFKGRAPELPSLSFGSWVGGDRDGHPFVTSEVTATTLSSLREAAIEIHDRFLAELEQNLTFNEYTHAVLRRSLIFWNGEVSRRNTWKSPGASAFMQFGNHCKTV